jgi:hypothetical protein
MVQKFSLYPTGNTSIHHYIAQPVNVLFGKTVAVLCGNHTEHTDTYKLSSYLTANI